MHLVFLGAPGAGKGTQADKICTHFNLQHVSTGNLFRENLSNNTELGQLAKQYLDKGALVPDDVTAAMVKDRLEQPDIQEGFILDGFPRTQPQAEALDVILNELNRQLTAVLYYEVANDELVARLSGRFICRSCQHTFHKMFNPFQTCPYDRCEGEHLYQREDDKPEVVGARLDTYNENTAPLIDYYDNLGLLVRIDGMQDIEKVTQDTIDALDSRAKINS